MADKIQRNIYFYKFTLMNEDTIVEPLDVFSYINSLPFDINGRYFSADDGNMLSMYVDTQSMPLKLRFGTTRRSGLPSLERRGETSPLDIPEDSGLYEPTHMIIFPDGVIGAEFNYYGPRPTRLRPYLPSKAPDLVDEVELVPLIKRDIYEQFRKLGEIKVLDLAIQRDQAALLAELDDNLPDAMEILGNISDAEVLGLYLRPPAHSKKTINVPFISRLPGWLQRPEVRESIHKLKIRGTNIDTGKIEFFDLLQDYILSKKDVIKQDDTHRSVNTEAMYGAIREAHNNLRSEIHKIIQGDS